MKPLIFVSSELKKDDIFNTSKRYYDAIEKNGGTPFSSSCSKNNINEILNLAKGILFTGGYDICSSYYNEKPHEKQVLASKDRDEFELALIKEALKQKIPIMAICRGNQLLNVALGGTLEQHIENHFFINKKDQHIHKVKLVKGGQFEKIYGVNKLNVNSIHHQIISKIGEGLKVECLSEEGHIEGVSYNKSFAVGLQWHPEWMLKTDEIHNKIFEAFINATSNTNKI